MTFDDFKMFHAPLLKAAYRMFVGDDVPVQMEVWYTSLKNYDRDSVETAIRSWIGNERYKPTPADIILMMPSVTYKPNREYNTSPKYVNEHGKARRIYTCLRCKDTGVLTFAGKDGYIYGVPCDCPVGHEKYRWGWLTEEEQKEAMRRNPNEYKTSEIGENWNKINAALRNGEYKTLMESSV